MGQIPVRNRKINFAEGGGEEALSESFQIDRLSFKTNSKKVQLCN
jgi:hypothetical protein